MHIGFFVVSWKFVHPIKLFLIEFVIIDDGLRLGLTNDRLRRVRFEIGIKLTA